VFEFFLLLYGLRLRVEQDLPVMFAGDWVAKKLGLPHGMTAHRAIRRLVEWGILVQCGELDPLREGRRGTRTYLPAPVDGQPPLVERAAGEGTRDARQPAAEGMDESLMAGAELAVADGSFAATGYGAGDEVREVGEARSEPVEVGPPTVGHGSEPTGSAEPPPDTEDGGMCPLTEGAG
jgi:hypothetical protein